VGGEGGRGVGDNRAEEGGMISTTGDGRPTGVAMNTNEG
jgi:hypothetical protein